ncbi:uncharacterized protein TNCV_517201 [Trichonephila clavipes]|nr:uncharacterized protein TNCV_517201 [Trichonephila clavipes]
MEDFGVVDSFTYLGPENCTTEIQKRVTMANRCLNGMLKYMKSNLIKRKTKVRLSKSLLKSVLTYACETWSMSRTDENMISIYERKILIFIFGGIQEKGTKGRRSNLELYQSYKESDIVNFIKLQRIKRAGHVIRMNEDRTTKKVFNAQPIRTQRKDRSNFRWN